MQFKKFFKFKFSANIPGLVVLLSCSLASCALVTQVLLSYGFAILQIQGNPGIIQSSNGVGERSVTQRIYDHA